MIINSSKHTVLHCIKVVSNQEYIKLLGQYACTLLLTHLSHWSAAMLAGCSIKVAITATMHHNASIVFLHVHGK